MESNVHLLIICNVLKILSQHQTYCGIDTRWKRKILKTTNIKECTCPICLLNRKLCERCYWLSGTNHCWFMHDRDWRQRKSGECKDFISKAEGKQKYKGGHFYPSIDEKNRDKIRSWRAFCEKTNPEQQK